MKLTAEHRQMIAYLYQIPEWSPLEIAQELGLTFRAVCGYIDRSQLRKIFYPIARDIRKATRASVCPTKDWGFEPPKWHQ